MSELNFVDKLICLLFYSLLVTELFPQGQSYVSTNGNINNLFPTRSIYNISTFTPSKKNNSAGVLDSLIYISIYGDRNRIAYNYNDDSSLNYFTIAHWFNGGWINSDKHTNTYNSDGNLESVLWEWFNTSSGEWFKDAKDVYDYDSLGNRDLYLHMYFNGHEFVNDFKYENCYDTANNLVSSVNQDWIDSIWVNRSKSVSTYTPENVNDTALFQVWTNNEWINYQLNIYKNDEKLNIISNQAKRWQSNNWLNFAIGSFEYDVNNNCLLETWEITSNNNWENWFRIFYEYDDNNNLIHLFGEEWENYQWVPGNVLLKVTNPDGILFGYLAKEIFLYYSKPTSVGSEKNLSAGFSLFQNYPNPFNPVTTIQYSISKPEKVSVKVYDLLGREVALLLNDEQTAGYHEVKFDASNLASGTYIYRIVAGDFVQSRKMILMK